ncbi:hypothetical protein JF535_06045 [Microbulbifer salipaludis]|uniref:Uncharacterized protein n=1 Tax=Microbulbifer salipaludis TaxID=187980 RepID=A0ABS3E530_9GAMM|nr:hypothetical protein [Microbulbifer salipaludis]MBN8430414.1 hypothetical protein [Microbulbifer salipaludis]
MKEALKNWWATADAAQKNGLIVLGAFLVGAFLLTFGIVIGKAIAPLM